MTSVAGRERETGAARRVMPGFEGLWVLIAGDMALFTLLFGGFLSARWKDPAAFEAARDTLNVDQGGLNTILLITSSWCVAQALLVLRRGQSRRGARWLTWAILAGLGFVCSKVVEYVAEVQSGHVSAEGEFFLYYFILTGLHLAHVVVGCSILSGFRLRWRRYAAGGTTVGFESAAIFWHLVDLLWIVLFPLLYLVR